MGRFTVGGFLARFGRYGLDDEVRSRFFSPPGGSGDELEAE